MMSRRIGSAQQQAHHGHNSSMQASISLIEMAQCFFPLSFSSWHHTEYAVRVLSEHTCQLLRTPLLMSLPTQHCSRAGMARAAEQ